MEVKRHIPNLITLGNLACGFLAVLTALGAIDEPPFGLSGVEFVGWLVGLALVFDFADGFVARALGVTSEVGKQLDSLSDLVTFGVLPGVLMFLVIDAGLELGKNFSSDPYSSDPGPSYPFLPYIALLLPLATAYRLAKFNIDEGPNDVFRGLPSPASGLFFLSVYLIATLEKGLDTFMPSPSDPAFASGGLPDSGIAFYEIFLFDLASPFPAAIAVILFSALMLSKLPLLALKFKTFAPKPNLARYLFLGISLILLLVLRYKAVPAIMVLYFLLSFIDHKLLKRDKS